MERIKLDVVKKLHKEFHHLSVAQLASKLSELELSVRACYHKFLDMDSNMLSWIMTVDSLFLFYQVCQHGINKNFLESSPFLQGLADNSGKKLADATIRRDVDVGEPNPDILRGEDVDGWVRDTTSQREEGHCRRDLPAHAGGVL